MFDDFKNIRTFPARTRVFQGGVLAPELGSDDGGAANLPLHIIHIGRVSGIHNWLIDANEPGDVFFTARIETAGETKINIEINPNLENIGFDGKLIIKNSGNLTLNIVGNNNRGGTGIKCETKLFAAAGSETALIGLANIPADSKDAETDIRFSVLADRRAKRIEISPAQRISAIPKSAGHGASLYRPNPAEIRYLETAGLSDAEAGTLLNQAFMEEAS